MSFISHKSSSQDTVTTHSKIQIIKEQLPVNLIQKKSYISIESKLFKVIIVALAIILFPWAFAGIYLVMGLWKNYKKEKLDGRLQ